MLEHGGKLIQAARQYRIPIDQWLDLSTGLNPHAWPASDVPADIWARLPEEDDGLIPAARDYYGGKQLLAVAGSQAAIQALPRLRDPASHIAILHPAYAEHAHAWRSNGFSVTPLSTASMDEIIETHDVILLVNPNNPSGECFSVEQCLCWHGRLRQRGGWLIVDEAFMDVTPEGSLVPHTPQEGLIVLRSLGKFFGLAGVRLGFVFAEAALLSQLAELLGPWPISGPSRFIAKQALRDVSWQENMRGQLKHQGQRLQQLLTNYHLPPDGGCALFQWLKTTEAPIIHEQLARQGILTRLLMDPVSLHFGRSQRPVSRDTCASLRFGLPAGEQEWARLEQALSSLTLHVTTGETQP
ncbi:L-threonine 3-O-phosphate decarboxylase [hydrothermal vent metagenome]|uniref:threonine-phosphate decarboxylase n=1 Tax=hydrothermal vent metagenome TaxID=652676 RepID=A0A3B1AA75_9ZZZZ